MLSFNSGYLQKRQLLQWMRAVPLLKHLPEALGLYFAREVYHLEDAEIARMDLPHWLSTKISDRVSVFKGSMPVTRARSRLTQASKG